MPPVTPQPDDKILLVVVIGLLLALLIGLGGILVLAMANPARSIPDVLVGVTTGILGLVGGILVPSRRA